MLDDEKKARAAALREELKNGRNRPISEGSGAAESLNGDHAGSSGATVQASRGASSRFTPTGGNLTNDKRQPGNHARGVRPIARPTRIDDRRSGERDGGTPRDSAAAESREARARIGRLETDEAVLRPDDPDDSFERSENRAIPVRTVYAKTDYKRSSKDGKKVYVAPDGTSITPEEYKQLGNAIQKAAPEPQPKKQRTPGKVLTTQEVRELKEPFIACLKDIGGYVDKAIWLDYPEGTDTYEIWGNLTDDEAETLGDVLLKWGTHNVYVAQAVRTAVDWKDYAAIVAMLAPRIDKTVKVRKAAPRRKKPVVKLSLFRKSQEQPA